GFADSAALALDILGASRRNKRSVRFCEVALSYPCSSLRIVHLLKRAPRSPKAHLDLLPEEVVRSGLRFDGQLGIVLTLRDDRVRSGSDGGVEVYVRSGVSQYG